MFARARRQHQRGQLPRCGAIALRLLAQEQLPRYRQHLAGERRGHRLPDARGKDAAALRLRAAGLRARGGALSLRVGRWSDGLRGERRRALDPAEAGARHGQTADHGDLGRRERAVPIAELSGPPPRAPRMPGWLHPLLAAAHGEAGRRHGDEQPGRDRAALGRRRKPWRGDAVAFAACGRAPRRGGPPRQHTVAHRRPAWQL
mmetsp:Transcript_79091/g.155178  ORF Transcript_79091/g.155178 Transcript_79091/m.155178 type:complete len:203 (+) Transcript_79091:246-854(+)